MATEKGKGVVFGCSLSRHLVQDRATALSFLSNCRRV
jgi:hypothetical protein